MIALSIPLLLAAAVGACAGKRSDLPSVTLEPTGTHHVGKFIWRDLLTDDVPAVKRFYGELFGWEFEGPYGAESKFTLILRDDIPIGGIYYHEPDNREVSESQWVSSLSVADVDQAVEYLRERGGTVHTEPEDIPDRGRIAVVSDPQGALLVFARAQGGDPPDRDLVPNNWMWTELWTRDISASVTFYRDLVGYEHVAEEIFEGREYDILMTSDRARAGVLLLPWTEVRPNWLPYVLVQDPVAAAARVEQLGGRVLIAPAEDIRSGSIAIVSDPSGGTFAMQKWPPENGEGGQR